MRVYRPVIGLGGWATPRVSGLQLGRGPQAAGALGGSRGILRRQSPALPWVCRRAVLTEDPELVLSVTESSPVLCVTLAGLNPSVSVGVC